MDPKNTRRLLATDLSGDIPKNEEFGETIVQAIYRDGTEEDDENYEAL